MSPLIMFAVNFLRIRNSVLQTISVVLLLGTGVLFLSACYLPEAWAAGVPETRIFHEQLYSFFWGEPLSLNVAVTDPAGVTEVRCYFRFDRSVPFVYSEMAGAGGDVFTATIPAATSTVKEVEYLFLVVNGQRQAILSSTFTLNLKNGRKGYAGGAQNLEPERYQLKTDVAGTDTDTDMVKEFFAQPGNVDISPGRRQDHFGVLAGLYTREQIGSDVAEGYFGVFRFDSSKRMMAVKGYIITDRGNDRPSSQEKLTTDKEAVPVEETPVIPDISGGGWTGWFWRSDVFAWTAVPITATVTQDPDGRVTVTTSMVDLGHYFEGNIDATGNLLLYDAYDGEDWSTHDGPVTDIYIKIEDYVVPPTLEAPAPPMNIIMLTREPKPKLPIAAISLLLLK